MPAYARVASEQPNSIGANSFVAQRIRQARLNANLSQAEVGERLLPPRSHAAVSDIERGKTTISVDLLMTFAVLFDRPILWFLPGGEE